MYLEIHFIAFHSHVWLLNMKLKLICWFSIYTENGETASPVLCKEKQVLMPASLKLTIMSLTHDYYYYYDLIISHFFVCTKDEVYKRVEVLWGVMCQVFLGWER